MFGQINEMLYAVLSSDRPISSEVGKMLYAEGMRLLDKDEKEGFVSNLVAGASVTNKGTLRNFGDFVGNYFEAEVFSDLGTYGVSFLARRHEGVTEPEVYLVSFDSSDDAGN